MLVGGKKSLTFLCLILVPHKSRILAYNLILDVFISYRCVINEILANELEKDMY